jgi:hypothetical protein
MLFTELYESPQLDEISMNQIGRKIGKGVGAASRAVGATVGGAVGAWDAAKQGYSDGRSTVAGKSSTPTATQTTAQPTATGPTQIPTQTGAINPATGKAYVPSDFPDEKPAADAQGGTPAPTPTAPTPKPNTGRTTVQQAKQAVDTAVNTISKVRSRDKQSAIAYASKAVSKIPNVTATPAGPASTAGAKAFDQMTRQLSQPASSTGGKTTASATGVKHTASPTNPNQPAATTTATQPATAPASAPAWTGRTKSAKVSAPPSSGAPTADERAKLDQKIQAALAKQPVAESLTWSKSFDPSRSLLKQIKRS